LAEHRARRTLAPALRQTAPAMLERLRGIADGASLPFRALCFMNALESYLGSCSGRTLSAPPGACSALAVRGSRSRDGQPVVAKNFDYLPLAQPFFTLRESRPQQGWRSLDFAVAPQAGTVDGMNEQGLCITLNYAFATDPAGPAPLVTMVIAEALAGCSTVAEAIAHVRQRPHWGAGILMLADASGDLASLELSNTRSAVRRPNPGSDWIAFTNVCRCPETMAVQVAEDAVFSNRVPAPLRGQPVVQWHSARAQRIEDLVNAHGPLDGDGLAAIMADHGPQGVADGSTPCVHTDYWRTTAALQWYPSQRALRVSYSTACTARYAEFSL
jgi:hypothetical protein